MSDEQCLSLIEHSYKKRYKTMYAFERNTKKDCFLHDRENLIRKYYWLFLLTVFLRTYLKITFRTQRQIIRFNYLAKGNRKVKFLI